MQVLFEPCNRHSFSTTPGRLSAAWRWRELSRASSLPLLLPFPSFSICLSSSCFSIRERERIKEGDVGGRECLCMTVRRRAPINVWQQCKLRREVVRSLGVVVITRDACWVIGGSEKFVCVV